MISDDITLPESKIKANPEKIKEWIQDSTLQRVLILGYLFYEIYRLLFTALATAVILLAYLVVLSFLPLEDIPLFLSGEVEASSRMDGIFLLASASALFVIISDILLSKKHRSTISYLCILLTGRTLKTVFTIYRHFNPKSDFDPEILEVFSEELVDNNSFHVLLIHGILSKSENFDIEYHHDL